MYAPDMRIVAICVIIPSFHSKSRSKEALVPRTGEVEVYGYQLRHWKHTLHHEEETITPIGRWSMSQGSIMVLSRREHLLGYGVEGRPIYFCSERRSGAQRSHLPGPANQYKGSQ